MLQKAGEGTPLRLNPIPHPSGDRKPLPSGPTSPALPASLHPPPTGFSAWSLLIQSTLQTADNGDPGKSQVRVCITAKLKTLQRLPSGSQSKKIPLCFTHTPSFSPPLMSSHTYLSQLSLAVPTSSLPTAFHTFIHSAQNLLSLLIYREYHVIQFHKTHVHGPLASVAFFLRYRNAE